ARDAVLAAEDARYYQHGALDLRGIARAIAVDLTSGHLREGGSTIAQQYVKNVVTGDRRSLHRKLVEAVDAAALERTASKDRILAAYLNQVYFGDGVYGIATAAQHYFSRPVGKLSLAQAAALAGTIASPERFRPPPGRGGPPPGGGPARPPAAGPGPAATWSWTAWRRSGSPARPGWRRPSGSRWPPRRTARPAATPTSSTT